MDIIHASEYFEDFLNFCRQTKLDLKVLQSKEMDCNDAIQDLQHNIEFEDHTYHEYAKLSKAIKKVRNERREIKKQIEVYKDAVAWMESNESVIKSMEKTLGILRKKEKEVENRSYNYRTSIIEDTLYSYTKK